MVNALIRGAVATALILLVGVTVHSRAQDVLRAPGNIDTPSYSDEPSDAEIRDILVQDSINRYTGTCACPYHRKFNRRLFEFRTPFRRYPTIECGDDSEYVRPGGPTVLCFRSDVPDEMVEEYREHLRSTFLTEPQPKF